jgi:RimJ/RimL family protein N-acetyltransferase
MLPLPIPPLETERLRLRGWRDEDHAPFADLFADETTGRFLGGPCGPDEAWRRMSNQVGHWVMRGYGAWALEEKASGRWVGYSGLWNPYGWPGPELMWAIAPGDRGRGYATEAAGRARDYAYRRFGWTTLISCIAPDNLASHRVAQRLGATLERSIELRGRTAGIYRHPGPSASNA